MKAPAPGRVMIVFSVYHLLRAMNRIDEATAEAVTKAMARAVARGRYLQRLGCVRRVGSRPEIELDMIPPGLMRYHARYLMSAIVWSPRGTDIHAVRDWLLSTKENDPVAYAKIPRMEWAAIWAHSQRRQARLARKTAALGEAALPGHPILVLDDGSRWELLDTAELRKAEGDAMGHCVGMEFYGRDECLIVSLRGPDGRSLVTAEFVVEDGYVHMVQHVGPKNAALGKEWVSALLRIRRHVGAVGHDSIIARSIQFTDLP